MKTYQIIVFALTINFYFKCKNRNSNKKICTYFII